MSIKQKVYNIIRDDDVNGIVSDVFDGAIIFLIILNCMILVLQTFNLSETLSRVFNYIELFSVIVFSIEYILRLWTSDLLQPMIAPGKARIKYVTSFMALIDLFAILPFYLPFLIPFDLRMLRMFRIIRLFRLFKLNRYTSAFKTIFEVFAKKKSQIVAAFFIITLLMIIASLVMFDLENAAQPDVFTNAFSGLWWAVATFTTVGYGDIFPITVGGKLIAGLMAFLGIGLVAVPTGIISAGFIEAIDKQENVEEKSDFTFCPHCGKKL